jgi:opacity protein-like surface antigen
MPGETTLRLPLGSESYRLYGLLSPYVSLGSSTALGVPWNTTLPSSLRNDSDGPDSDLRLGAGLALPLSSRAQIYGEYRFLRGRLDPGIGRGLIQREPDSADFRAGFSIRLN